MLAAQNGHVGIVRTLLEHEADPRLKSEAGETALHYATRNPDTHTRSEIFSLIQDAGGDASVPNAQGLSASDLLRRGGNVRRRSSASWLLMLRSDRWSKWRNPRAQR
eukprot:749125-Hanusia_phi.AAC.3